MRRPEGPAAVSLGKDRNIAMIFISAGIKMGVSTLDRVGAIGQSLSGCLDWSSLHVSSVCGATPGEVKTWQALLLLLLLLLLLFYNNYTIHI